MKWFWTKEKTRAVRMYETSIARLSTAHIQLRKDLKILKWIEKTARSLLDRLLLIVETTADDIEDCEKRLVHSERALEALRSEHKIATEVEIPGLMANLGRYQASHEADIAVSNHRRAGASPIPVDRELQ